MLGVVARIERVVVGRLRLEACAARVAMPSAKIASTAGQSRARIGLSSITTRRLGFRRDRWATFDCYGTLVDWDAGLRNELEELFGSRYAGELLTRYHDLEPEIQASEPRASYRKVLTIALARLAVEAGLVLPEGQADALASSLPRWPVFDDVCPGLTEARARGWRLGISRTPTET